MSFATNSRENFELSPLRNVHTSNLPAILSQLGISPLVSTYQVGKWIDVRTDGQNLKFNPSKLLILIRKT